MLHACHKSMCIVPYFSLFVNCNQTGPSTNPFTFGLTTTRLTAECSTIELSRIMCLSVSFVLCSLNQHPYYNTSCKFVNTFFKENSIFLIACLICNDSKHFKEDYTLNRCYFPLKKTHQPVN